MKINYFGEIADITKCSSEEVQLKHSELSALKSFLEDTYQLNLEDIHIAINHKLIAKGENVRLKLEDEVAILSPFAGG